MIYNKQLEIEREDIMISYPHGAGAYLTKGVLTAIRYNTGDWIWFKKGENENEYFPKSILTDDGVSVEIE